ncbi:MAG: hypothetical protein ACPGVP_02550, partial [Thiolinea sp.]
MKKNYLATVVCGALLGPSLVQAEVTLYDYQEASSAYEDAYVSGDLNVTKNRGDDQAAYNLNLGVDFDRTLSSADRDLNVRGDLNGSVSRAGTSGADSESSYTAGLSATYDKYFVPGSNGAFWFGSASLRANDAFDDLETTASAGVGYGRVTNVTPMAKTIRVMDELVHRGILNAKPAKSVYQQVAGIVAKESEYASRHGSDYELKWLGDIETAIKSGGGVANLGAAGVLKIRDVLVDENISLRRYGWKVRAGLGYVGTNFDGLTDKPLLTAGAEYHQPLSNQTQLSNEATFNAIVNDGDNGYNFNNQLSLTHEVDDRIDWENTWNLNYAKNTASGDDVTTNSIR